MATERVRPMTPLLEAEYSAEAGQLVLPAKLAYNGANLACPQAGYAEALGIYIV
jgi:hypothetical protein